MPTNASSAPILTNDQLTSRLEHCTNLPSPPGVAERIIKLCQDPNVGLNDVADAVKVDPALSAKILRLANSAIYARQRKTDNLRQAILMFGLNGTLTLALSFSLVKSLRGNKKTGMDYNLFWRRSLAAATACRCLGNQLKLGSTEDLFIAGLLQDIGMLALDKLIPDLYRDIGPKQGDHVHVETLERELLGTDHAAAGAWLLHKWNLPERWVHAVAGSHDPSSTSLDPRYKSLVRCVAVAGATADIVYHEDHELASYRAGKMAQKLLDLSQETLVSVLKQMAQEMHDTAALFDVDLGSSSLIDAILDQAKELLMLWNLRSMQTTKELQQNTFVLETRARELEETTKRDGLTKLYNRAHLDVVLREEFENARTHKWPLSLIFVDLDHFKQINDSYGHQIGDEVLRYTAKQLDIHTRNTDTVARYGGEEFVIILPGTAPDGAITVAERLRQALRSSQYDMANGNKLTITASVGIATMVEHTDFDQPFDLMKAADSAVYSAKRQGRDRIVVYRADSS